MPRKLFLSQLVVRMMRRLIPSSSYYSGPTVSIESSSKAAIHSSSPEVGWDSVRDPGIAGVSAECLPLDPPPGGAASASIHQPCRTSRPIAVLQCLRIQSAPYLPTEYSVQGDAPMLCMRDWLSQIIWPAGESYRTRSQRRPCRTNIAAQTCIRSRGG
ncbi:hypothetical protein BO78DRAFT_146873 [Aspergillus sclerotiicarbonarius CBS 121057]|uniref:Uncharacterized protein n=1 Tax=Aspergillus sclerotiicarbonarius (strain CBS 121057 / IBT 28362) TaxID=1448318 RepID=A0A319E855_ASPSB|nr:hypothetical protein BO78DRAFT_146873 [Aspergillus sclerotiicarbonarius CBS 121057]